MSVVSYHRISTISFPYLCQRHRLTVFTARRYASTEYAVMIRTLYIHNSLSFTPGLKPTSFTNLLPVVSLLPPGLPPRTIAWTFSSELLGF